MFLVSRGIKEATGVNAVITISKFVPIFVAITAIIFLQKFDLGIFLANMSQGADPGLPFFDQVSNTMMITIWVFVGIEGAVAISGRAKKERDVGKATIIAFICVLSIYLMVSVLSMGVMPLSELANWRTRRLRASWSTRWGSGAPSSSTAAWCCRWWAPCWATPCCQRSPYEAAEQGVFIKAFAKTNKKGAPIVTLVVTNVIIERSSWSCCFSDSTYQFFYALSAGMILLPYLLSAALALLTFTKPDAFKGKVGGSLVLWRIFGVFGVVYSFFLAWASGATGSRPHVASVRAGHPHVPSRGKKGHCNEPYLRRRCGQRWWWPSSSSPPSRRSCCCSPASGAVGTRLHRFEPLRAAVRCV